MSDLRVGISADNKELKKGLKDSEKALKGFGDKVNNSAGKSLEKLGKTTRGNALPALNEFSRVIQDAPFGIQGVANNITQLTTNLGTLSRSSGGAGGALKALAGSFLGPGGIIFAVSTITSLWVVYEDELKEAIGTQSQLQSAFKSVSSEIGESISRLTTLKDAYIDSNTEVKDKERILGDLRKEYPKYFGELDTEQTKIEDIEKAYNDQKQAIIGLGIQKALEAKKAPLYAKLAELEIKSNTDLLNSTDKLFVFSGQLDSAQRVKAIKELGTKNRNAIREEIDAEIAEINKGIDKVRERFAINPADEVGGGGGSGGDDKKRKERARRLIGLPTTTQLFELGKEAEKSFEVFFDTLGANVNDPTNIQPLDITKLIPPIPEDYLQTEADKVLAYVQRINEATLALSEGAENIIKGSIADTFLGLGEIIGEGLANGADFAENGKKLLLGSVGSLLTQLGQLAIEIGVGLLAIQIGLSSLNPAVAIAAGVALVALGKVFSSKSKAIGSQIGGRGGGGGGRSGGADVAGQGSSTFRGGASTSASTSGSGGGEYVFRIRGTDLIGVLQNTTKRNQSLGGNLSITG